MSGENLNPYASPKPLPPEKASADDPKKMGKALILLIILSTPGAIWGFGMLFLALGDVPFWYRLLNAVFFFAYIGLYVRSEFACWLMGIADFFMVGRLVLLFRFDLGDGPNEFAFLISAGLVIVVFYTIHGLLSLYCAKSLRGKKRDSGEDLE